MNAADIKAKVQSLPELPVVQASNMLTAQGYVPTVSERAAIKARADFFKEMEMPTRVSVKVVDFSGQQIGSLEFFGKGC